MLPFAITALHLLALVAPAPAIEDPKTSADVVTVRLEQGSIGDGLESYYVTLKLAYGWSVYANPEGAREIANADAKAGVKTDAKLATTIEFLIDNKLVATHSIYYPTGHLQKDAAGNTYRVYTGHASFTGWLNYDDTKDTFNIKARVMVIATDGKRQLKESIVTAGLR